MGGVGLAAGERNTAAALCSDAASSGTRGSRPINHCEAARTYNVVQGLFRIRSAKVRAVVGKRTGRRSGANPCGCDSKGEGGVKERKSWIKRTPERNERLCPIGFWDTL